MRDYIHVEDLGRAHILALEATEPGRHPIYNLGTGDGSTVREVIEAARRVTGKPIEVREESRRPGDPPALVASSERIRKRARLGAGEGPRRHDRRRVGLAPGAPRRLLKVRQRLGEHGVRRLRRVEHHEALRLRGRQLVVGRGDRAEEREPCLLEPVRRAAARSAPARPRDRSAAAASGRAPARPCRTRSAPGSPRRPGRVPPPGRRARSRRSGPAAPSPRARAAAAAAQRPAAPARRRTAAPRRASRPPRTGRRAAPGCARRPRRLPARAARSPASSAAASPATSVVLPAPSSPSTVISTPGLGSS